MIGLYEGIETALLISFFTIIVNPLLAVMTVKEAGILDKLTTIKKAVILTIIYLTLATVILFIIRNFLYKSLEWLLLSTLVIGLMYIYFRIKRKLMVNNKR